MKPSASIVSRLALAAVLAAALGLAACGRKGPLDLPPSAAGDPQAARTAVPGEQPADQTYSPRDQARPRKPLPIDAILN